MNKLEANVSLLIITFFAAIQYAFLAGVPDSVSHFAFLCITNLIGFLLTLVLFFSELFRIDRKQVKQSLVLSLELFGFNVFLLLGSSVGATVSACILSAYFVFLPALAFLLFRTKPDKNTLAAIAVVLAGLILMMNGNLAEMRDIHFLYLLLADIFFALYILTVGKFSAGSNPAILAMGQMLFNCLTALAFWLGDSAVHGAAPSLPVDPAFWGSAIFIGFFIRGLYGIVQMYAQRYVSPLNTSLIFSTEIIITMLMSPVLALLFGTEPELITPLKLCGAGVMVAGILMADPTVTGAIKRRLWHGKTDSRRYLSLIHVSAAAYLIADLSVQLTGVLHFGSWIGIKNFLPVTLGLFLGPCGVAGGMLGCIVTAMILQTPLGEAAFECNCIAVIGTGMWLLWHTRNDSHRICFKQPRQYLRYVGSLLGLSVVCGLVSLLFFENAFWPTVAAYTALGLLVGLPVNIILGGLFCLSPVLPPFCSVQKDVTGTIEADASGLDQLNELLEERAGSCNISRKRVFEVENCIEEVALRILKSVCGAQIRLAVDYSDAISIRFSFAGEKYNPLRTGKDEDEVDLMSLKLIKHRALRVMYRYKNGENHLHIVI